MTERDGALPPPERGQHDELLLQEVTGPGGGMRAQVRYPRRIDRYFAERLLGDDPRDVEGNALRYEAATRYADLARRALPQGRSMLSNLHRVDSSSAGGGVEDRMDAKTKLVRVNRVVGARNANLLLNVLWDDMSAYGALQKEYLLEGRKPPRRSAGMFRFRGALRALAGINHRWWLGG